MQLPRSQSRGRIHAGWYGKYTQAVRRNEEQSEGNDGNDQHICKRLLVTYLYERIRVGLLTGAGAEQGTQDQEFRHG